MEPPAGRDREFIATLCALSTIGASATGLTFGFEDETKSTPPRSALASAKRKAPGSEPLASSAPSRSTTVRRIVSQPVEPTTTATATTYDEDSKLRRSTSRSFFGRRTLLDAGHTSSDTSTSTVSRGSSHSRHRGLRSKAGEPSSGDGKDSANSSTSWLRRISMISNLSGSGASSRPGTPSVSLSNTSATPMIVGEPGHCPLPRNKLVKRSSSHRILSSDQTGLLPLRRPATSHQRTATFRQFSLQEPMTEEPSKSEQCWRPYFDSGNSNRGAALPRKRHTSGVLREPSVRTISDPRGRRPTLLLGTSILPREDDDELDDVNDRRTPIPLPIVRRKKRPSSRRDRRIVTDPGLAFDTSPNLLFERSRSSPLSPISHPSTFEVGLPSGTPAFSDPTTAGSDNVFTDDDSLDFRSDTAYDSLATRATASSHSGLRGLQIGTIFDENNPGGASNTLVGLEELIEGGSLEKRPMIRQSIDYKMETDRMPNEPSRLGTFHSVVTNGRFPHSLTPPTMDIDEEDDDYAATPVPKKTPHRLVDMQSSPPVIMNYVSNNAAQHLDAALVHDEDDFDWNKTRDPSMSFDEMSDLPELSSSKRWTMDHQIMATSHLLDADHNGGIGDKKSSIFDWSEHQRFGGDHLNGSSPRPKTVHGRQGNDIRGSRSTGRRGPSAVHLRSQSVPVARDANTENEQSYPIAAKFGTWGLGNKGPSEEWSDDFEFDDHEETEAVATPDPSQQDGSVRGMKVPQAIIDRQASVHGQFGQVQEFMLLVEELKRLRLQGSILQLLTTQSRQLWEDAESIINLATLNDDEDDLARPRSPSSPGCFDAFDEDTPPSSHNKQQASSKNDKSRNRTSIGRRSISSPATPPTGRPRGESLALAKSFLQTIHQKRTGPESSPDEVENRQREKLPFDTQDLRDLVVRAGVITRALKEIIRKAEGVAVSPTKSPKPFPDPAFSQIFNRPDSSPSPTFKKPGIPKSRSANSYLGAMTNGGNENELSGQMQMLTVG